MFLPCNTGFCPAKIHLYHDNRYKKNTITVVINIRYNVTCTNAESPHFIDTKVHLFYIESYVRVVVTGLVVC